RRGERRDRKYLGEPDAPARDALAGASGSWWSHGLDLDNAGRLVVPRRGGRRPALAPDLGVDEADTTAGAPAAPGRVGRRGRGALGHFESRAGLAADFLVAGSDCESATRRSTSQSSSYRST